MPPKSQAPERLFHLLRMARYYCTSKLRWVEPAYALMPFPCSSRAQAGYKSSSDGSAHVLDLFERASTKSKWAHASSSASISTPSRRHALCVPSCDENRPLVNACASQVMTYLDQSPRTSRATCRDPGWYLHARRGGRTERRCPRRAAPEQLAARPEKARPGEAGVASGAARTGEPSMLLVCAATMCGGAGRGRYKLQSWGADTRRSVLFSLCGRGLGATSAYLFFAPTVRWRSAAVFSQRTKQPKNK